MSHATASTAIVTGGAAGIGLASVARLLEENWTVFALDRSEEAIAAARGALAAYGDRVQFETVDVTDKPAIETLVARVAAAGAPLRGLVTCAGIVQNKRFLDTTEADFRRLYEVNVIGTFTVAKAAAEAMGRTGGGSIVTISSISGIAGNVGRTAYGSSKGAIVTLTRVMAVELASLGIRVNSIAPGPIETAMAGLAHSPAVRRQWSREVPLGRYGNPEEVAEAICWLISDRSSYVTGQIIPVDGGFTAAGLLNES